MTSASSVSKLRLPSTACSCAFKDVASKQTTGAPCRNTCSAGPQAPDDDADDDDRWIDEQIRKGTAGSADPTAVAAVRSAAAAAAVSAAAAPSGAYARQLDGLGAAPSSTGLWQQQPEQLLRAGQDVMLTLQQGVAQLQVVYSNTCWSASPCQGLVHVSTDTFCT